MRHWRGLVAIVVLAGCSQAGSVSDGTDRPEGDWDAEGLGSSVVTLPVEERDYGMYHDAIMQGSRTHPGSIEAANWTAACVAESGFSVTVVGPGAIRSSNPSEQQAGFSSAYDACLARAEAEGVFSMGVPDDETLRVWYRAYFEVAYECLNERGYPTTPPPSVDVWVQDYERQATEPNAVWHPHDQIWSIAESLEGACSQDPVELLIELGRRDAAQP